MIRHLDYIHLPTFFSGAQQIMSELRSHVDKGIVNLSGYMRYNELTLAGSVIAINLGLVLAAKVIMDLAYKIFRAEFLQKSIVRFTASVLCVGSGISTINHLLNLQLDTSHLVFSVIFAMVIKYGWQEFISPIFKSVPKDKEETKKKDLTLPEPQDPVLDDGGETAESDDEPASEITIEQKEPKTKLGEVKVAESKEEIVLPPTQVEIVPQVAKAEIVNTLSKDKIVQPPIKDKFIPSRDEDAKIQPPSHVVVTSSLGDLAPLDEKGESSGFDSMSITSGNMSKLETSVFNDRVLALEQATRK